METDLIAVIQRAQRIIVDSTSPPDVFAALFDVLSIDSVWQSTQDEFINAERNPLLISDDEGLVRARLSKSKDPTSRRWTISDQFREEALDAIRSAAEWCRSEPRGIPDGAAFPRKIAYLARDIDAEALPLSLYNSALTPARFQEARETFNRYGTFTSRMVDGRVIPGAAHTIRGNSAQRFFSNFLRIPQGADRSVQYLLRSSTSRRKATRQLHIGFLPTIQQVDDVRWGLVNDRFTVGLNPKREHKVIENVLSGLKWLIRQNTDIVIIPELVSSEALRKRIGAWLRDEAPYQPLFLVGGSEDVISNSSTGHTNRCFVIGPSGRELWVQDKHNQFALWPRDIHEMDLESVLGTTSRNEIGTSTRSQIVICDIPNFGRFCVLVCEDFARDQPGQDAIKAFGVDMSVVIVMDGRFPESGWRKRHALRIAEEPGSRVAIGNSRAVLLRLPPARGRGTSKLDELAYYCLQKQWPMTKRWWPKGPVTKALALLIAPKAKL